MVTVHARADCAMPAAICGCPLPMAHPRGICIVLHLLQHQPPATVNKKRLRRPHAFAALPPLLGLEQLRPPPSPAPARATRAAWGADLVRTGGGDRGGVGGEPLLPRVGPPRHWAGLDSMVFSQVAKNYQVLCQTIGGVFLKKIKNANLNCGRCSYPADCSSSTPKNIYCFPSFFNYLLPS
jgi:hypothetical protein